MIEVESRRKAGSKFSVTRSAGCIHVDKIFSVARQSVKKFFPGQLRHLPTVAWLEDFGGAESCLPS